MITLIKITHETYVNPNFVASIYIAQPFEYHDAATIVEMSNGTKHIVATENDRDDTFLAYCSAELQKVRGVLLVGTAEK